MRALLEVLLQTSGQAANHVNVPTSGGVGTVQEQGRMAADQPQASTVAQLRDELVAIRPLEADWIARVNQAEAEYWKLNCGTRRVVTSSHPLKFTAPRQGTAQAAYASPWKVTCRED